MNKNTKIKSTEVVPVNESVKMEIVELDDLDLEKVAGGQTANESQCSCTNSGNCVAHCGG